MDLDLQHPTELDLENLSKNDSSCRKMCRL